MVSRLWSVWRVWRVWRGIVFYNIEPITKLICTDFLMYIKGWFVWVKRVKPGMIRETRGRVWEGGHPGHILDKFLQILENFGKFWKISENFGKFWKILEKICTHWCFLFALSTIFIDYISKNIQIIIFIDVFN